MNKILMVFLIIGLMFAATACSSKSDNVSPVTGDNNVNVPGNGNSADTNMVTVKTTAAGSIQKIEDIKKAELLNSTVTVRGIVVNNFKMGTLSGYRLKDGTDSIPISTPNLAAINSTVTITGTLKTSSYFGFYVLANE